MHLAGYLEAFWPPPTSSPLVEATAWVEDDLFWSGFLFHVGMARLAPEAFGADLAGFERVRACGGRSRRTRTLM